MFQVKSNQYIPFKTKLSPSGMPLARTYYYVTNAEDKVINKRTAKPYRGKQMNNFAFHDKESAEKFAESLCGK